LPLPCKAFETAVEARGAHAFAAQSFASMALIRLFGHPVLDRGDGRAALGVPPKAVALLALLAANHARPLSREWLAQSLWPDDDPTAGRANLRRHFHLLVKALGDDAFVLTRHTAQWNAASAHAVDVIRFEALANAGSALALDEYAGDLCAGISEEALDALRLRYRTQYETFLLALIRSAQASHDDASLLLLLQRAVGHDPLDEDAVRELMRLRRRSGDRSGAIREYNALAVRLQSELSVEPQPETTELFREIVAEDSAPPAPNNLRNAATTFVGRERELAALAQALAESRIVTLTGPGGIGKSRLATRCCFDLLAAYRDGIWFVELDYAGGEAGIWERIADALQLPPSNARERSVLQHLREAKALVVFDTCEHVLQEVRSIAERLSKETTVTVLATSRRRLHARGERVLEVEALEVPPLDLRAGDVPLRYGAFRLFLERAALVSPAFRVEPAQIRIVSEMLRSMDGLPLAIELVASRANVLTIDGMRKRLSATMRARRASAAHSRQQTIDDAIAWSYELLSSGQREVFEWLSIFHGDFTADDVESVCSEIPLAIEALFELAEASLVAIVATGNDVRYRLLETTRAFAGERLAERGAMRTAYWAHAQYLATKADALAALPEVEYAARVESIAAGMADYLAALQHCAEYGWIAAALRLLEGLYRCGMYMRFARELLACTQALITSGQPDRQSAARVNRLAGMFAGVCGELPAAAHYMETACRYYREAGDDTKLCEALSGLAVVTFTAGRYSESERMLLEVEERTRLDGAETLHLKTLGRLGALYLSQGDFERALRYLEPAAAGLRRGGDVHQLGFALKNLAVAAHYAGRQSEAVRWTEEALALPGVPSNPGLHAMLLSLRGNAHRELGSRAQALGSQLDAAELLSGLGANVELAECVEDIAATLAAYGECEDAARLLGMADAVRLAVGSPLNPGLRRYYDQTVQRLQARLGREFAAALKAGAAASPQGAHHLARESLSRLLAQESSETSLLS
jgi:predicted ATPase